MSRGKFIALAIFFAIAAIALPIAATLYGSWVLAVGNEQSRLELYAQRAVERTDASLNDAEDALRQIAASDAAPCSTAHIARMRQITLNSRTIREIGYFENGLLICTSWGPTDEQVRQATPEIVMPDGLQMTLALEPKVSHSKPMMALQLGPYNVLVDPERFVDLVVDPDVQLAVVTNSGALIGALNGPAVETARGLAAGPQIGLSPDSLFATARRPGWTVVATERRDRLFDKLQDQQLLLLPLGALLATPLVGAVIWLSRRRLSPLGELTIAAKMREFVVVYQPIIEMRTGRCIGAEALVRWRRPDGLLVTPEHFIPLAEQSGLILRITDQVVEAIAADLGDVLTAERSLHISFNVSARDVETARILDVADRILVARGIEPRQIWLEITERSFVDKESARATIMRARRSGYVVAIDDFGTGYSSLSYLQELPLDVLKIDKSFIDTIGIDSATSNVCPHIIEIAKTLGLTIVAEGVETKLQADYLTSRGVEFCQGWLYSKAVPVDEFMAYCGHNRPERAA